MSVNYHLPNEGVSHALTEHELATRGGIQAFYEDLTEEQKQRFDGIAHHLVHLGLEEGLSRYYGAFDVSRKERQLSFETEIFLQGAGQLADEITELGKE